MNVRIKATTLWIQYTITAFVDNYFPLKKKACQEIDRNVGRRNSLAKYQ